MSMGDKEEEDEKVFHLVSNISKDNITAHFLPPLSVFSVFTVHGKHFMILYLKYASFASQYSRLNSPAVHVSSGVYKIKLWLAIQIHYILPKSYLLVASVEIKSKDTSFPPKNRNVGFICAFQMRATFMKQLQRAALYPSPLGIRCQSTNVLCRDGVLL